MDFGIGAIFDEFDKRLGRPVSNIILICLSILILVTTARVILETVYGVLLLFERIGTLAGSEDANEIALYVAARIIIWLILFAFYVLLLQVYSKRFVKKMIARSNEVNKRAEELLEAHESILEFAKQVREEADELERQKKQHAGKEDC